MKSKIIKKVNGDPKTDIPKVLYKYRNWKTKYHSRILTHNEVFFTSPKDCNDPFDCRITERYISRTPKEIQNYKNRILNTHSEEIFKAGFTKEQALKNLDGTFDNLEEYQKNYEESFFKYQDTFYGLFCLCKQWNNILMWSHYSNNHQGFCVGIKGEILISLGDNTARGGGVSYSATAGQVDHPRPV